MQQHDQHAAASPSNCHHAAAHPDPTEQLLPTELFLRVLSHLPPNDLPLNGRLTCRDAARHLSKPHHLTAYISLPHPPHAYHPSCEATAADCFRQLPFARKLASLELAAASGSKFNLELAWRLLQPSIFSQLLTADEYPVMPAPAAASAGHVANVLRWLADRGVPLHPVNTLSCVARNAGCSLADLQAAWEVLKGVHLDLEMSIVVLEAAAASQPDGGASQEHLASDQQGQQAHGDVSSSNSSGSSGKTSLALDKMAWILETGGDRLQLRVETAVAAARSGDLARLEWRRRRGCPFGNHEPLVGSLRHADLCISEWLVREAGCKLPSPDVSSACAEVAGAAAGSLLGGADAVIKLQWVHAHGIKSCGLSSQQAAAVGNLEAVAYLHEQQGVSLDASAFLAAAGSGSVPLATWLTARGCATCHQAYATAARRGDLTMVRWLAAGGHCAWSANTLRYVIGDWPADAAAPERARRLAWVAPSSRTPGLVISSSGERCGAGVPRDLNAELLEAVRLLVAAGCRPARRRQDSNEGGEEEAGGNDGGGGGGGGGGADGGGGVDIDGGELMEAAARRGYLPLVLFLQQECGCPVGWEVVAAAAAGGCEAVLEWAVGQVAGAAGVLEEEEEEEEEEEDEMAIWEYDPRVRAYVVAGENGDAGTLACLRRLGVRWGRRVLEIVVCEVGKLPVVRWVVEQGARADERAVKAALDMVNDDEGWEELEEYLEGLLPGGGVSGEEGGEVEE